MLKLLSKKLQTLIILLSLVCLLIPISLSAQLSLGVIVGSNMGKFGGYEPNDAEYASRTGLNIGASFAYRLNNEISLTFQPMYSQRGSNIEVGEDSWKDTLQVYEVKLDFLILPLFIKVYSDNRAVYFVSGIEFGVPLSAEVYHADQTLNISDYVNKIDILASIGMGLRFSLGKPDLTIEFRYYQGLVNFNASQIESFEKDILGDFKNSGFQLMAGLEWEL